ncbi:MAG: EamA family transporter [Nostocoides sp.]
MRRLPPQVLLFGSIASVQFGAGIAVRLFDRVGPGGAVMLRLLLSALVLVALARPSIRGRSRSAWLSVLAFGLILGVMNWSFYEALDRIPLGIAVTIEFLGPLGVALLGSRRPLDLLWCLLAAAGVAVIALPGSTGDIAVSGILLAAFAGVLWGAYILASQRVGSHFPAVDGLAFSLCVAAFVVLPIGIHDGGRELAVPSVLIAGFAIAMLSSLIPYSLELVALRRLTASAFGLLMSVEPAMGAVAGALVLRQHLGAATLLAIGMVIVASVGTTVFAKRSPPVAEPAVGLSTPP